MNTTQAKVEEYIAKWTKQGYEKGIPEEVPQILSQEGLAPSYKAICLAILNNDITLKTLSARNWREDIKRTGQILGNKTEVKTAELL
jgi:predicted phosphoadenosine phosphosulfate sulfurtransferase